MSNRRIYRGRRSLVLYSVVAAPHLPASRGARRLLCGPQGRCPDTLYRGQRTEGEEQVMPANRHTLEQVAHHLFPSADRIEHLGTGGFASTFRVTHGVDDVAVKIIDPSRAEVERVQRELVALRKVVHPNVVRYRSDGIHTFEGVNYSWVEMDYIEGRSLAARWNDGWRPSLTEAVELITQAIQGATAIWDADTAHRDLTPNNLMVDTDGNAVIVDLGLARAVGDDTITVLPTPGTPGWMSPEQVSATDPEHGTWRSDQYVLGLVAYLLVTGARPFTGSVIHLLGAPANTDLLPVSVVAPWVPSAISEMIAKMTSKRPSERYLKHAELSAAWAAASFAANAAPPSRPAPTFGVEVGHFRGYLTAEFVSELKADTVVIQARAEVSTSEQVAHARAAGSTVIIDPVTYLARSPDTARPRYFQERPYGTAQLSACFTDPATRTAWCTSIVDALMPYSPDVLLAPHFFAATGELRWIEESLRCAEVTGKIIATRAISRGRTPSTSVRPTVAVSWRWLAEDAARADLLDVLVSADLESLHLLVHTTQDTFSPLGDGATLTGLVDVIATLNAADTPVFLGRRSTCGLLMLSLGARGWSMGCEGKLANMTPHPDKKETGGPGYPHILIPALLNAVTPASIRELEARGGPFELTTPAGQALHARHRDLGDITSRDNDLVHRHNLAAARDLTASLTAAGTSNAVEVMRELVSDARAQYASREEPTRPSDSGQFLTTWHAVLNPAAT